MLLQFYFTHFKLSQSSRRSQCRRCLQIGLAFITGSWSLCCPSTCTCMPTFPNLSHHTTKPTKWHVCPVKPQISLGIHPVWSESSLSAWRKLGSLATHCAHSKNSDQTGRMPKLICVFTGRTVILLVLSWGGWFHNFLLLLLVPVEGCHLCGTPWR